LTNGTTGSARIANNSIAEISKEAGLPTALDGMDAVGKMLQLEFFAFRLDAKNSIGEISTDADFTY